MGFLNMLGLMRVEDHNRIVAKQDAVIDLAASHMKGEDFDGVKDHAGRVALVMSRLWAARTRIDKNSVEIDRLSRGWDKCGDDLKLVRRQLDDSEAEIASLRPDAEKFRAKAARDAEVKRAKRAAAKKVAG